MIGCVKVYIDEKPIYRVSEIGRVEESKYMSLTFADRGYIPRISRFKYHKVQLIYWCDGTIMASGKIITKGHKRRKNTLYLKVVKAMFEVKREV